MRLAELAKRAGIRRFLYASTCSVYGAAGDEMLDEDSAFNPVTPYAESKARAETDIRRWRIARSARCTCAPRPPSACRRCCASISRSTNRRLGGDHRAGVSEEPRHLVAAAGAHRGHRARLHHAAARARGQGAQPRVQHRAHRGELPDPRRGGDRAPDGAEHQHRVRPTPRRICATTGSAASGSRASCPNTGRTGRCSRGRGGLPGIPRGLHRDTSRARATTGSPI